jgi:hypothetical protein
MDDVGYLRLGYIQNQPTPRGPLDINHFRNSCLLLPNRMHGAEEMAERMQRSIKLQPVASEDLLRVHALYYRRS